MATIYPEETIRSLREKLEIIPVLKAINYRLDTIQEIGETVKCFCPIHREAVFRTLIIEKRTRRFRCSYSLCKGHKGGDLIDLYALALGLDYDEAVRRLVAELNIPVELPPAEDFIQKTLEVSENYLTLHAYDDALAGFKKVLSVQPDNLAALKGLLEIYRAKNEEDNRMEVLARLASVALEQKKFDEAAEYCREILENRPDDADIRLKFIECLIGQNEVHKALEEYMRLADFFESRNEFDRALEIYRKIEDLDLDIIDVYPHIIQLMVASDRSREAVEETLRKAADFEREGEYEHALECYRYVLNIDESRADVREKLIDTAIVAGLDTKRIEECLAAVDDYIREEAYGNAARALEKLRRAAPGHPGVLAKYVEVLRKESRDSAAIEVQLDLVEHLLEQGRLEEAAAQLRSVGLTSEIDLDKMMQLAAAQKRCGLAALATETYLAAAERLERDNRAEEAAEVYDKIIEMNPAETTYRRKQVELYLGCGKTDRAIEKLPALLEQMLSQQQLEEADGLVKRALQAAPDDLRLLECHARILGVMGRTAEALERYLKLAKDYAASGRWEDARRPLLEILGIEPNHVEAALLLADVETKRGEPTAALTHLRRIASHLLGEKEYERAEPILRKLHELVPDDPLPLVQLAAVYSNLGQETNLLDAYRTLVEVYAAKEAYPKALEYCAAILDRDPENIWALEYMVKIYEKTDRIRAVPEICLRLAKIYEKLDDADHVEQYYERAIEIEPENVQARLGYIQFLISLHRYQAASNQAQAIIGSLSEDRQVREFLPMVENLLEHTPDDIALRRALIEACRRAGLQREFVAHCTQLINLYYRRNEFAEVAELYRRLLEIEPDNVTFRTHLIDALMRLKRREEAIEQYFELVDYYIRNENYEDAENTLVELLDQSPGNPRALEMLVEILIEAGRHEDAIQRIRELSEIYVGVGKNDKAVEVLKRALAFDPDNREMRRRIAEISREDQRTRASVEEQVARAAAALKEGNLAAAIEAQREAVRLRPDDAELRRQLAEMLARQGSTTAAADELIQIARLRTEQGDFEKALEAVDELLARDPSNYAARRLRAEIFAKMGDRERALEEFMRMTPAPTPPPGETARPSASPLDALLYEPLKVVPEFTFDTFVVGDRNRFAYATALSVAKAPAVHYNPLFIYSDVGLGKTHLISAIANYIADHQPDLRVLYTSAEEFTSHLVNAIQNNAVNAFRSRYKATDVLLVDDIQFLAGKERAQEEFFHVFNTLFQAKRQIVITCDRPPKDIARLEKRLKSRFGSGVIVDIQPPDLETRTAILKRELERHDDVEIDDRLILMIAENIQTNVRDLKGALKQILVKHQLSGAEINEDLVREILDMYVGKEE